MKSIIQAKQTFMKKVSLIKALTLFLGTFLLISALFQCTKEGNPAKFLDRAYVSGPDSTVYASFYESNKITPSDAVADVNDVIKFRGVQTIIHEYCGTSNCHGGPITPKFDTYSDITKYIVAGNPSGSKLWDYITTNDFDKAMPPVNSNHEMNTKDKGIIFNWILNGAKERPTFTHFRPAAISLIINGCGSANCHNQATATGGWARKGLLGTLTTADTTQYTYVNPLTTGFHVSDASEPNSPWRRCSPRGVSGLLAPHALQTITAVTGDFLTMAAAFATFLPHSVHRQSCVSSMR